MSKRTLLKQGRKQEIINAAAALFSDRGYHATSVRAIAEESGILSGSLYAHISHKEDLLFEIVMRSAGQFLEGLEPIVASVMPPEEKLRHALRSHLRVAANAKVEARVFLHEWRAIEGPRKQEVHDVRDKYEGLWETLLGEGVRSGAFRDLDLTFVRLLIMSVANWAYQWYDPAGTLSPEEVADHFIDLIFDGIYPRSGE